MSPCSFSEESLWGFTKIYFVCLFFCSFTEGHLGGLVTQNVFCLYVWSLTVFSSFCFEGSGFRPWGRTIMQPCDSEFISFWSYFPVPHHHHDGPWWRWSSVLVSCFIHTSAPDKNNMEATKVNAFDWRESCSAWCQWCRNIGYLLPWLFWKLDTIVSCCLFLMWINLSFQNQSASLRDL